MVRIPGGNFEFRVSGIEIEGGNDVGVDVQYPWEDAPRRHHLKKLDIKSFYIDKFPVTNAEFKRFLDATHYQPERRSQFSAGLEGRHLSGGLGEQAGDVGVARRCARLRRVGGQAASARVGVAVCRAGNGRPRSIPGATSGTPRPCRPPDKGRDDAPADAMWMPIRKAQARSA